MTDFTEEARQLLQENNFWSAKSGKEITDNIATALSAAYERGRKEERERCAVLCEDTAMTTGGGKPTHDIYIARPATRREDLGHHAGMGYAALIRSQP